MVNKGTAPGLKVFRFFVVCSVVVMLIMSGKEDSASREGEPTPEELKKSKETKHIIALGLPEGATNVKVLSKQWYSFTYNEECFLLVATFQYDAVSFQRVNCKQE